MGKKHTCKNMRQLLPCIKDITDVIRKHDLCNIERRQLFAALEYMEIRTEMEIHNKIKNGDFGILKKHLNEESPGVT